MFVILNKVDYDGRKTLTNKRSYSTLSEACPVPTMSGYNLYVSFSLFFLLDQGRIISQCHVPLVYLFLQVTEYKVKWRILVFPI